MFHLLASGFRLCLVKILLPTLICKTLEFESISVAFSPPMISCNSRLSIRRWRHASPFRRHILGGAAVNGGTLHQHSAGWLSLSDWTAAGHGLGVAHRQLSSAKLRVSEAHFPTRPPPKQEQIVAAAGAGTEASSVAHRGRIETLAELRAQAEKRKSPPAPRSSSTTATSTAATTTATLGSRWRSIRKMMSTKELKRLMKQYGPIALAFHSTVFLSTLGGFYAVVDYGFDVQSLVARIPFIAENVRNASAGNLAIAWALTTCTGPVRGIMTITISPRLARIWWGREARRKLEEDDSPTAPEEQDKKDRGSEKPKKYE